METKIGARLTQLREASGKSRATLARDAGVTYAFVRQLELGERAMPRGDNLSALADALGVSVDSLLGSAVDAPVPTSTASDERAVLVAEIERRCVRLDVSTLHEVLRMVESFTKMEARASR
jgi:transcriptional regulator with XRE-family HTH domain